MIELLACRVRSVIMVSARTSSSWWRRDVSSGFLSSLDCGWRGIDCAWRRESWTSRNVGLECVDRIAVDFDFDLGGTGPAPKMLASSEIWESSGGWGAEEVIVAAAATLYVQTKLSEWWFCDDCRISKWHTICKGSLEWFGKINIREHSMMDRLFRNLDLRYGMLLCEGSCDRGVKCEVLDVYLDSSKSAHFDIIYWSISSFLTTSFSIRPKRIFSSHNDASICTVVLAQGCAKHLIYADKLEQTFSITARCCIAISCSKVTTTSSRESQDQLNLKLDPIYIECSVHVNL